jgi:hypothetical protein
VKALFNVTVVFVGTLALVGVVVFGLGDRTVLVSPPEAVAENFARELAAHRFKEALRFLSEDLVARTNPRDLKSRMKRLESSGGSVLDVVGEPVTMDQKKAQALAVLEMDYWGRFPLQFRLVREEGMWRIADLGWL